MAQLEKYQKFGFLPPTARSALARADTTQYDKNFLLAKKKRMSEFFLKEISIKSSMILTLWYSLFDFTYLTPHLLEKVDSQYTDMCFQRL